MTETAPGGVSLLPTECADFEHSYRGCPGRGDEPTPPESKSYGPAGRGYAVMLQSFFDPGHGFLSSFDELAVAVVAFALFVAVGALAESLGDAKGGTVVAALVGFVAVLLVWGRPPFAEEWHYAVVVAVPVVVAVYLYRRR